MAAAYGRCRRAAGQGGHGRDAGVDGGDELSDEDAEGGAGHAPGGGEADRAGRPGHRLDDEVDREVPVVLPGLQQTPVDRHQHPDPGGGQDLHHATGAGQRESADQRGTDEPDGEGQDDDGRRPDAVDADDPGMDAVAVAFALPGRDPPDDGDEQGRAGHRENEEQTEQDDEGAVATAREQPGHEDGGEQAGHAGGGTGGHDGQHPAELAGARCPGTSRSVVRVTSLVPAPHDPSACARSGCPTRPDVPRARAADPGTGPDEGYVGPVRGPRSRERHRPPLRARRGWRRPAARSRPDRRR